MDADTRSAGSDRDVNPAPHPHASKTVRRGERRWPWLIGAGLLALVKADAYRGLDHHRSGVIVVLAVGLAFSVLRAKPVATALVAAPLVSLVVDPASTVLGIGLAVGAFAAILTLFAAIGTVLRAR